MLPAMIEIVISACLVSGSVFVLLGALGLAKLPDFYSRLHGPSKASTLGVGGIVLASLLYFSSRGAGGWHELLLTLFLLITAPLSAHMLARAALRHDGGRGIPLLKGGVKNNASGPANGPVSK